MIFEDKEKTKEEVWDSFYFISHPCGLHVPLYLKENHFQ